MRIDDVGLAPKQLLHANMEWLEYNVNVGNIVFQNPISNLAV